MAIQSFSKLNLLLIVLLCFSCEVEDLLYDNSRDEESSSFVEAPTEYESIDMLSSITDTSIGINIIADWSNTSDEKRIMIERNIIISDDSTKNDITFFIYISEIEGSVIIDTHRVRLEKTYEYKVRNGVGSDPSDYSKPLIDTLLHILSIPENISVTQISAERATIKWDYNPIIEDSTAIESFIINRTCTNPDIPTQLFEVLYPNTEQTDSMLIPYNNYSYKIKAKTYSNNYSSADSMTYDVEFFTLPNKDWIPMSLEKISLQYTFAAMENTSYELDSLSIYRYNDSNSLTQILNMQSDFSLTLEVMDILSNPEPEENWNYYIKWCDDSFCVQDTMTIKTLPFRYMVLIPGKNSYEYGEESLDNVETVEIDSFYIGIYEVPDIYYLDPSLIQEINHTDYLPTSSVRWTDAVQYCNLRTTEILGSSEKAYDNDSMDISKAGFRLPTKYEWEYAASIDEGTSETRLYSMGDYLNGSRANYFNSGDEFESEGFITPIGWFDGMNNNTEDSKSLYEIYDMNGNVVEWCNDSKDDGTKIAKGGYYFNEPYECRNTNEFSFSETLENNAVGFRTAISAKPFLDFWK